MNECVRCGELSAGCACTEAEMVAHYRLVVDKMSGVIVELMRRMEILAGRVTDLEEFNVEDN